MRDLLDLRQELQAHQFVLARVRREAAQNDDIVSSSVLFVATPTHPTCYSPKTDIVDRYEKGMKEKLNDYRNQSSRKKYGKVKEYVHFKEMIWVGSETHGRCRPQAKALTRI